MTLPFDTHVLVVDDFESMRRILKQVLHDIGFRHITLADDGTLDTRVEWLPGPVGQPREEPMGRR